MKVFYDKDGNVVGMIDSATPAIEAKMTMADRLESRVPSPIAERLRNPNDPLLHTDLAVEDGRVIVANPDRL